MKLLYLSVAIFSLCVISFAQPRDFTRHVNPFIGTGGHGHTFPGATMPFGMVQLSPDTRVDNWDGSSGYHYSDDIIYGFSHTHLSGTGIPDGCDILLMPASNSQIGGANSKDDPVKNGYASKFSHTNEKAEPGYYSVLLDDDQILAELTATTRVGLHRYTFPKDGDYRIVLDLGWRDKVTTSELRLVGDRRIEGYRQSASWARNQKVYFVAEFSKPLERFDSALPFNNDSLKGKDVVLNIRFDVKEKEQISVKVALSSVSIEGARKNLASELPGWDFDKVRADTKAAWNKELSKIEVSGGTDDQTTNFYTALYHTMIHPNVFNDVDGRYKGHDGKIHQLSGYAAVPLTERRSSASPKADPNSPRGSAAGLERRSRRREISSQRKSGAFPLGKGPSPQSQYTVFSLWDTFRAAHPLYTIIDQKRTVDFINTFIRQFEKGGRLPVWELWGEETDTMIGYHAVSVIADAMAKGIKGFDYEKAYAASKHSAELDHFGLAAYKKRGYISMEDENESVSKTLEYAYNDWCIMTMGTILFNTREFERPKNPAYDKKYFDKLSGEIEHYRRRAGNFENLFDTETGFFRPKQNGGFVKPFAPQEVTFHFTEANAWQYAFFAPHDVTRLISLMGGTEKFIKKLDELFTTESKLAGRVQPDITGLIGQYAHGNEPSHHVAYLYNYVGVPSKTQKRVRQIMDEFYKPTPDGLIGNEDCGQMSAWYVISASGFYSVVPGHERYDLGTPLFKQVTYNLENGKKFVIRAPKVSSSSIYIKSAKWNGEPHQQSYITHQQIMSGGVLELEMSDAPNDKAFEYVSTSTVYSEQIAVPAINGGGGRVFSKSTEVTFRTTVPRAIVRYTLDGTEPRIDSAVYSGPFNIDKTTTIKAAVFGPGTLRSPAAEAKFIKRSNDWTVKIASTYNRQYTGGGDEGLIDGIRGTTNFASGEWQGYQPQDFVAVIDLQKETEINRVGGGFLQVARSWIWMPTRIEFEVSSDNVNFVKVAEIKTDVSPEDMAHTIRDYVQNISPVKARYVRVKAYNLGKIPAWHPGAGEDAFIFVDEIFIS